MPYVYPACPSTPSHTPTASQYKSFRSIPSNKAYKNTNKYFNQNSSSRPDYEQYATTSLSVLLKPRTNFEKVDEPDLETQENNHTYFVYLCTWKNKTIVYTFKSWWNVLHGASHIRHPARTMYCICIAHAMMKMKENERRSKPMKNQCKQIGSIYCIELYIYIFFTILSYNKVKYKTHDISTSSEAIHVKWILCKRSPPICSFV